MTHLYLIWSPNYDQCFIDVTQAKTEKQLKQILYNARSNYKRYLKKETFYRDVFEILKYDDCAILFIKCN